MEVQPEGEDGARFRVQYYEVEAERYEEVLNTWDYDKPGMLLAQERHTVVGVEALRELLLHWVNDLAELKDPGAVETPI